MNIIEAVKSHSPFRRKAWGSTPYRWFNCYDGLCTEDILADDWEVEKTTAISRTIFDLAWERALEKLGQSSSNQFTADLLAEELGL